MREYCLFDWVFFNFMSNNLSNLEHLNANLSIVLDIVAKSNRKSGLFHHLWFFELWMIQDNFDL